MEDKTKPKRLTVKQAAEELGVSVLRVHQLIQEKRLPAEKLGRDWIIESANLESVRDRQTAQSQRIILLPGTFHL